jgi:arginyl-tRNA synthetase
MKGLIKEKLETLLREKYSLEGLNYTIEEPKDRHLGDLATNVCFLLSKHLKKPPHAPRRGNSKGAKQSKIFRRNH